MLGSQSERNVLQPGRDSRQLVSQPIPSSNFERRILKDPPLPCFASLRLASTTAPSSAFRWLTPRRTAVELQPCINEPENLRSSQDCKSAPATGRPCSTIAIESAELPNALDELRAFPSSGSTTQTRSQLSREEIVGGFLRQPTFATAQQLAASASSA
jgi:hypothetical protein